MALQVNGIICTTDILNKFLSEVKNVILSGAYHSGNIPYCGGYQCVPSSYLASASSLEDLTTGSKGEPVTATTIYNALINMTTALTRVGTFSYVRRYKSTDQYGTNSYSIEGTMDGKAVFTTAHVKTLASTPTKNILQGEIIRVVDIATLVAACLTSWNNTTKYHYTKTETVCHSSCHSNCHSSCYSNCHTNCYGNTGSSQSSDCWTGECYTQCN